MGEDLSGAQGAIYFFVRGTSLSGLRGHTVKKSEV
jgi:hypothetical protein